MFEMTDLFVKTNKIARAAHNIARHEWIGAGKTFQEIDNPGSFYKTDGIVEEGFDPRKSPIERHLMYDIENNFIAWYRLMTHVKQKD